VVLIVCRCRLGCPNHKIEIYIWRCNLGQQMQRSTPNAVTIYSGLLKGEFCQKGPSHFGFVANVPQPYIVRKAQLIPKWLLRFVLKTIMQRQKELTCRRICPKLDQHGSCAFSPDDELALRKDPPTEPAHNNGHKFSTGLRGTCRPRFRKRPKGYRYRGPTADTVEVPCNME
jgi:hypothetical protein